MQGFESALTEAMVSGLNPMNGIMRDYARSTIKQIDRQLEDADLDYIAKVDSLLRKAIKEDADPSVISAYKLKLEKATA